MALKIRLSRVGTKNEPHYRVVVAEERSRRDGDAVERLGLELQGARLFASRVRTGAIARIVGFALQHPLQPDPAGRVPPKVPE